MSGARSGGTDAFFDGLYAPFRIQRVDAARAINSAREKRRRCPWEKKEKEWGRSE